MLVSNLDTTVSQSKTDSAFVWCDWEAVRKDDNWLVSFVDLLIILLATLVVLIGQASARNTSPQTADMQSTATLATVPFTTTSSSDSQDRGVQLASLVQERFRGEIRAVHSEQGVVLEISDAVLFDSARATLRESASSMLIRLAATLQESGDSLVSVEGHTDDRAVQSREFRSNWELAAARAYAVTHFLIGQGLAAERLRAVSYADTRPTADNGTAEGRAANRRVELRVEFSQN